MTAISEHKRNLDHHRASKKLKKKKDCGCSGNQIVNSFGELVIVATRTSFNLAYDLPYAIWGVIYSQSNSYAQALQQYLPAGVTVTTSTDPTTGNIIFLYTEGRVSDQIIVSTAKQSLVSYSEILANLNQNFMNINFSVLTINSEYNAPTLQNSDINYLADFGLIPTTINALKGQGGEKKLHIIIPRSRKMPQDTSLNMFELYMRQESIKPDSVWIHFIGYTDTIAAVMEESKNNLQFVFLIIINEMIDVNEHAEKVLYEVEMKK